MILAFLNVTVFGTLPICGLARCTCQATGAKVTTLDVRVSPLGARRRASHVVAHAARLNLHRFKAPQQPQECPETNQRCQKACICYSKLQRASSQAMVVHHPHTNLEQLFHVHSQAPANCLLESCLTSGWTLQEFLAQCAFWAFASLGYTYACSKLLPTREFNGSPLYNWLSCLPIQLIGFPAVAAWCVRAFEGSFVEWLSAPWDQLAATPERIFLLLIYAYMFKDLGLYLLGAKMDAMYWAHHLGCWVIILQFFFTTAPGIFIFGGGVCMELGGASQTIHLLFPDSSLLDFVHILTMTLSHVVCCASAMYYATIPPTALWLRIVIMLLVFKLAQARQSNAMYLHGRYAERKAKKSK